MEALLLIKVGQSSIRMQKAVGYMGTIIVLAVLVAIVGLIVRGIIRDKKSRKSSCGGDCSHCRGCH